MSPLTHRLPRSQPPSRSRSRTAQITGVATTKDEIVNFYDVVADGNSLNWFQDVTTPMKLKLKFAVTVDGDTMVGTSKAGIFPASKLQGTRTSAA